MKPYVKEIAWSYFYPYRVRILLAILYCVIAYVVGVTCVHEGMNFTIRTLYMLLVMPVLAFLFFPIMLFSDTCGFDILNEESSVPKRMLTSPIPTPVIVFWPMLIGCLSIMAYWLIVAECFEVLWLQPVDIPNYWPMCFAASVMAWMQVLAWRPLGSPFAKIISAGIVLIILFVIPQLGLHLGFSEAQMVFISGVLILVAYFVAIDSVHRARTGQIPQWKLVRTVLGVVDQTLHRRQSEFSGPKKSLEWFEWAVNGVNLPLAVAVVFPVVLMIALLNYFIYGKWLSEVFLVLLWIPVILSAALGFPFASFGFSKGSKRIQSFPLIRPISSTEIIKVKYQTAFKSILYCYGFVYLVLFLTIGNPAWTEISNEIQIHYSGIEIPVLLLMVMLIPIALCWTLAVIGMTVGFTGRSWVMSAFFFLVFTCLFLFLTSDTWIEYFPLLKKIIRDFGFVILVLIVSMKILITGWALRVNYRKNLMSQNEIRNVILIFSILFVVLWGLSQWLVRGENWNHIYNPFAIVLLLPMLSVAFAPLSLHWNRHR